MGGKDEWPNYPFNEYMPALEAKDGKLWNVMAEEDEPFSEGTPFNKAYQKIQDLYDAEVLGPDPQGLGYDQARAMFAQQQAGMLAAGAWLYGDMEKEAPDKLDDLGAFYLPTRDSESDEFVTISQADEFLAISQSSENVEMAKNFVNFYLGEDWYPEYIQSMNYMPTVDGVEVTLEKPVQEAVDNQKDVNIVLYDGGGADYNAIVTEIKFDYKKLGAEMMTPGFDIDKRLEELNAQWKEARTKLSK
jgi:raffinose/stachyose/melibiose transport system substrate-binding protein